MPLNLHKVFHQDGGDESFTNRTAVHPRVEKSLRTCRNEIRSAVRDAFNGKRVPAQIFKMLEELKKQNHIRRPKFRMQGSFSYGTAVDPANKPPRQIDLDDGVFLPIRTLTQGGRLHPSISGQIYRNAVMAALRNLCSENDWVLTEKASCLRIDITIDTHLDLALYAVPDKEFEMIVENARAKAAKDNVIALLEAENDPLMAMELREEAYQDTALDDKIWLCFKDKTTDEISWKLSDPRKLERWFCDAVSKYGRQVRRVSKYLKSWRDFYWKSGGPASIALMAMVVEAYEIGHITADRKRDDKALQQAAAFIATRIFNTIPNPVIQAEPLDAGLTSTDLHTISAAAKKLSSDLHFATELTPSGQEALREVKNSLGDRITSNTQLLIEVEEMSQEIGIPAYLTGLTVDSPPAVQKRGDDRFG